MVYGAPVPLCEQPAEVYPRTWDVIFWSTYNVVRAFLPLMLGGGDMTEVLSYSYFPGGVLVEFSSNLPKELQVYLFNMAELAGGYVSANWDMSQ
ncbi:LMBR1 domain-containing protein 2 [Madurella mycetomatis]|uniref:LMBR1 domain-containing protein 2 n=1 Tax=Madurella mycetomatis TaxID=100816 RepID=A0A175W764_9PEZI|nr:LMBR1 domain-containing protein 2 [Madurella mycetomatis]KXX79140.1 LMBR1 domain-containing protein 2 [Madurella mycetomatis]